MRQEMLPRTRETKMKMGLGIGPYVEVAPSCKGRVFIELRDAQTGELLEYWESDEGGNA